MAHTPAGQRILQGSEHILQNYSSMVIKTTVTGNILFTELPEIVPFTFGEKPINQGEFAQLNFGPTKLWSNSDNNNVGNTS